MSSIPIVDLFAGPGGLGEGFTAYTDHNGQQIFDIFLSIEKDKYAHSTLELRSFFRKLSKQNNADAYFEYIRKKSLTTSPKEQEELRREFFNSYPEEAKQARSEAWQVELGKDSKLYNKIDDRIKEITNKPETKCWGMIGGPPCQAYSVIGRSRNKGKSGYSPEGDERSFLYQQYLRVLARHRPDFFIMENVKGMLSAKLNGKSLFEQIVNDLKFPLKKNKSSIGQAKGLEYQIYSLTSASPNSLKPSDFIVEAEDYGIPQARHRVILLGVRKDFSTNIPAVLKKNAQHKTVKDVLGNLPKLRSGLSKVKKENNTLEHWIEKVKGIVDQDWFKSEIDKDLVKSIKSAVTQICNNNSTQGSEYVLVPVTSSIDEEMSAWYHDSRLKGICNHTSRTHMVADLHRYLFAASYVKKYGKSPLMAEFPAELMPAHKNVLSGHFNDRFRVQVAGNPSTTVTSHISKDGHYFIHYDPEQCRSLTVREAARLQTFPDNYFFEGSRTQQYIQVGNAVPPLLAIQIAEVVHDLIKRTLV